MDIYPKNLSKTIGLKFVVIFRNHNKKAIALSNRANIPEQLIYSDFEHGSN